MKRALAVSLILALLASALAGTLLVNVSLANPYVPALNPAKVRINLPENKIYYPNSVPISFTVESPHPRGWEITSVYGIKFYLDGDSCENVRKLALKEGDNYVFSSTLVGVEEGYHSLYVVAYVTYYSSWLPPADGSGVSNVVHFTIELPPPPIITISSPEQQMYNFSSVQLDFNISKSVSWMGFSLDGQDNVTVAGNVTLSGLAEGVHPLTVYAGDEAGNMGASETISFTITKLEPFPTTLVLSAVVVATVLVCAGLLLYFAKFKRRSDPT